MANQIILVTLWTSIVSGQLIWKLVDNGQFSLNPGPRRDAALAFDGPGNRLVLFGGRRLEGDHYVVLSDLWVYDLVSDIWREIKTKNGPPARFSFVSGIANDYFYISTGEGQDKIFFNDIWRFSLREERWEELPPEQKPSHLYSDAEWKSRHYEVVKPKIRYGASGGIFINGSRFYVTHGFAEKRYADTFSYSIAEKAWFQDVSDGNSYNPSYPHARCLHAGAMIANDELVIYGGCLTGGKTDGPCPSGDSWIFNGKQKTWKRLPGCASARMYSTMAALPIKNKQQRVILYGGIEKTKQVLISTPSPADQVAVLDPAQRKWTLRKTGGQIPSKRASSAMATGPNGIFMYGGVDIENGTIMKDLYLLEGTAISADRAPQDANCEPMSFTLVTLHAILMVMGWGFFLQFGAFIARYFRHRAPLWFRLHQLFQIFGLILAIGGFVCGVLSVQFDHFEFAHGIIGLIVMILGFQQPLNAICRPHAPKTAEEKTLARTAWEVYHTLVGRITLVLALVNISLGMFLGIATKILWILWFVYLGILVLLYIYAEASKRCRNGKEEAATPKKYVVVHKDSDITYRQKQRGMINPGFDE